MIHCHSIVPINLELIASETTQKRATRFLYIPQWACADNDDDVVISVWIAELGDAVQCLALTLQIVSINLIGKTIRNDEINCVKLRFRFASIDWLFNIAYSSAVTASSWVEAFCYTMVLLDERVTRKDYLRQNLIDRANRSQLNKVRTSVAINSIAKWDYRNDTNCSAASEWLLLCYANNVGLNLVD